MNNSEKHARLVYVPDSARIVLNLLAEELKATHFFNNLASLGLDDCYFRPHLTFVILSLSGFEHLPDDLVNFYTALLDDHANRIEADRDSITKEALSMYAALMCELKRRSAKHEGTGT